MSCPPVTVVVPVYNAGSALCTQLEALTSQQYDGWWEIVVVDNLSIDGSHALAESYIERFSHLRVVTAERAQGTAVARNEGLKLAQGQLVLYCDQDDEVSPGWVMAMAAALARFDLVQGSFSEEKLNDTAQTRFRGKSDGLRKKMDFLYMARGSNLGVRRDVALAIGGWDEGYRGGGEDVDFAWRAQLAGYSIGYAREALVEYRLRNNAGSVWTQHYQYGLSCPVLYKKFALRGMPGTRIQRAVKAYCWSVIHIPDIGISRARRHRWIRHTAFTVGKLVGSFHARTRYL